MDTAGNALDRGSHNEPLPDNTTSTKIAQDFILQYYSVRSLYAESLYRFYRDDSTVTMGCHQDEKMVVGKRAIEELFKQMSYQNCQNSVAAFSAHFVSPSCVSILVSGEMSQNEEVSRRFCESFNLISYDVNRFYVKSHMFHFQDEAFHDVAVSTTGSVPTYEEPALTAGGAQTTPQGDEEMPSPTATQSHGRDVEQMPLATAEETEPLLPVSKPLQVEENAEVAVDGHNLASPNGGAKQPSPPHPQHQHDNRKSATAPPPATKMTWAGVASTSRGNPPPPSPNAKPSGGRGLEAGIPQVQHPPEPAPVSQRSDSLEMKDSETPPTLNGTEDRSRLTNGNRSGRGGGRGSNNKSFSGPRQERSQSPQDESSTVSTGASGEVQKYPDNQMLFVGNVPRSCSPEDLRQLFEQFGGVLDLRIIDSAQSRNVDGNASLPNYCFVTMESCDAVQRVLQHRPLKLFGTHRLNVEEKRSFHSGRGGRGGGYRGGGGGGFGSNSRIASNAAPQRQQ